MNYALDIETLGTRSNCIILSIGVTAWQLKPDGTYSVDEWLSNSRFAKLSAKTQKDLGRTIDTSTMDWWKKQNQMAWDTSVAPSDSDLDPTIGIEKLRAWIQKDCTEDSRVFIRGSLDQLSMDDLCNDLNIPPLFPYNAYRDFRTAIDVIYGSSNGYVEVNESRLSGYNWASLVSHNPVHDCVRDIAMLLCGKVVQ